MKDLKQLLEPSRSFLPGCEGLICDEILEERSHNGDGINPLINWFGSRREESIFGGTYYQEAMLPKARPIFSIMQEIMNDLIHCFKKTESQLIFIIVMDQCISSRM
jgi:hypothetical protein